MNLILLQPNELDIAGRAELTDSRARHIQKVLRAEPGKELRIGLLNGPLGVGTVESICENKVGLSCVFEAEPPPNPKVDLLLAMPRPKVLKRLWSQLAALGVGRIVILRAAKVERYYFDSHVLEPEFYVEWLMEGLQQAKCTHLPEVLIRPLFKPFMEDEFDLLFADHLKLAADPSGKDRLGDVFRDTEKSERVMLAVGPEGGWTPYELEMLEARNCHLFGLGNRVLRTDTATVGLLSLLAERMQCG